MKKIFLVLVLIVVVIISGCTYIKSGPNSEAAESLITRARNNINTNSFEGFTGESTFGDVSAKIGSDRDLSARMYGRVELLGYPAAALCYFSDDRSGKLLLSRMEFYVSSSGRENLQEARMDLLAKLDSELGAHIKENQSEERCTWEKDGLDAELICPQDWNSILFSLDASSYAADSYPATPDFLPFQLGADVYTANKGIKPGMTAGEDNNYITLDFREKHITISMWFKTDETGEIRLCRGSYDFVRVGMEFEESLEFYESLADCLENAMGAPYARGYGIPQAVENDEGIYDLPYRPGKGGQGLSAKDILDSGKKYYWFEMNWPGIDLRALYGRGAVSSVKKEATLTVDFNEEYFNAAN